MEQTYYYLKQITQNCKNRSKKIWYIPREFNKYISSSVSNRKEKEKALLFTIEQRPVIKYIEKEEQNKKRK